MLTTQPVLSKSTKAFESAHPYVLGRNRSVYGRSGHQCYDRVVAPPAHMLHVRPPGRNTIILGTCTGIREFIRGNTMADTAPAPDAEFGSTPRMHSVDLNPSNEQAPVSMGGDGDESAALMDGSVQLVDWHQGARPAEAVLLCLGFGLIWFSIGTVDWLYGTDAQHRPAQAGLRQIHTDGAGNATRWLRASCDQDMDAAPIACPLASAGVSALTFLWLALAVGFLLGACFVAQELDRRDLLGAVRSRLRNFPFDRLLVVPLLGWVRPSP